MYLRERRWSVFIYAILLINLWVVLAYMIFTKSETLIENTRYAEMATKLAKNIEEKAASAIDYDLILNKNGNGFTNSRVCPTLSLSGTAGSMYSESIPTSPYLDGVVIACSGSSVTYPGQIAKVTFDPGYLTFSTVAFRSSTTALTGATTLTGLLSDTNNSFVQFTLGGMSGIDANFNSDNYLPYSTGTTQYPDSYADDDDIARKLSFGFIRKDSGWKLIFWNNSTISNYIRKNSNNTGSLAIFPDATSSGLLRLDVDGGFSFRIVEFDPTAYSSSKELRVISTTGATSTGGAIWYLQNNLTFSSGTVSAMTFDLSTKNYGVFLSASGSNLDFIKYKLSFTTSTGASIYTIPLDDSDPSIIRYYGNDIIIDRDNYYVQKEMEIIKPK